VWKHPIEPTTEEEKRIGKRVIIYPAAMPQLEEEMNEFSQNPFDKEDGTHIAYDAILKGVAEFEISPRFYREDSEEIRSNPDLAASVPLWMNIAAQVSTGGRDLVLENGPDMMNSSDDESPKEEHGDELQGYYVGRIKARVVLSPEEGARQKAVAAFLKENSQGLPRSRTQPAMSESEGQLLEDIEKVGPMVTSVCSPLSGVPVSMSPSDDDPLVHKNAVDQLRREKAFGPSRYTGDASTSYLWEGFEFERPYFGLSHVVEGCGAEFKPFYSENHVVKLPTESRKEELRHKLSEIKQNSIQDIRLYSVLWRIQGFPAGNRRLQAIKEGWKLYGPSRSGDLNHEDRPRHDDFSLALKSFILNDFLEAQDELYALEHPMRPPPIRS
jgi:hypothetical protein